MDKRWIGIIIILIIGLSAMYMIADISNSVGNSVTVIGDVSVTLPTTFKTGESHATYASMYDPSNNHTIFIKYAGSGNNSLKYFKGNLSSLKNDPEITIYNYSSNGTIHTIKYNDPSSKYENHNETLVIFEKINRTFSMRMVKYDNYNDQNKDITFIIDNIKKDFKQNKAKDEFSEFSL